MSSTELEHDAAFMRRAMRLAMNGRGRVEPNPMVGCVIVKNGRIIGEGYHQQFGGRHAEPNALASCSESPQGATAYVTLEPCCHTNKKTPPCAPLLIEAKLARVVVGCLDPNEQVNGGGVAMLRAAGINVDAPMLEAPCRQLIAPFMARMKLGRPYVTLKWAQTADGKIAGPGGKRLQISNARSMRLVHHLRARCDAILVGINTVLADDPMLTARDVVPTHPLLRAVMDRRLEIPETARLLTSAGEHPLLIFCGDAEYRSRPARVATLKGFGVEIVPLLTKGERRLPLPLVLSHLGSLGITELLVEPGAGLASEFIATQLWDRTWVFVAAKQLNDAHAPRAVPVGEHSLAQLNLDGDILTEYLNPRSPAFFAAEPSTDFVLATDAA